MITLLLVALTLFVAYANGANDNFKGVATLYGSNTATFKTALAIGTVATFAGCISSVFLAEALVKAFSGKGLVPDAVSQSPNFLMAVAAGAASTVFAATLFGIPISTTHALTGALVGAGYATIGSDLNVSVLGAVYFLPLLLSPLISVFLTIPLYKLAHRFKERLGVDKQTCVCISPSKFVPVHALEFDAGTARYTMANGQDQTRVIVGTTADCVDKYSGRIFGITAQDIVDGVHYFSAAAVSFARGLNDTPKIVGLLLVVEAMDLRVGMLAVAIAMAVGGLTNARKVAETMSKKIAKMNDGHALVANLVTAFMVIFASRLGVPVSTTHVSVGAISGVGLVNGTADKTMIRGILLSWVLTLPMAAIIAAIVCWLQ